MAKSGERQTIDGPQHRRDIRHSRWRIVRYVREYPLDAWRYVVYSFGTGFSFGFLQVLLGLYLLSIGYRESFLATQQLVVALCSAGFSVLAGVFVDKLGTRLCLSLSALLTILGLSLLVADPARYAILGASAILGAGVAFYWVSQGPVLVQVSRSDQRAGLFGLNWAFFTASGFAGGLLAGFLPSAIARELGLLAYGPEAYRYTVWVGVLLLALTSVSLPWMHAGGRVSTQAASSAWWKIEQPRTVAALLIPVSSAALAVGFTVPFLSVFLHGTYNASTERIGLILGVFALVGSLGGLLGPAIQRRYGAVSAVSGLLIAGAPVMLVVGYSPGLGLATGALWLRGLLANSAWPIALAHLIGSVQERQRGRVSALMNITFELSLAAAALPAGYLMEHVSYRLPYGLAALALVLGGGAFLFAFRDELRPSSSATADL